MKILLTTNAVVMDHEYDIISSYQYLRSGSIYEMDGINEWDRTVIRFNLTFFTL